MLKGMEPRLQPVTLACDNYLDRLGHTDENYRHVEAVLNKFEFMVNLAVERALEQLPTEAVIIPFPRRPVPDGAA